MKRTATIIALVIFLSPLVNGQSIGLVDNYLILEFSGDELAGLDRIENTILEKINALAEDTTAANFPEFYGGMPGQWCTPLTKEEISGCINSFNDKAAGNLYERTNKYELSMNWDHNYGRAEIIGFCRLYESLESMRYITCDTSNAAYGLKPIKVISTEFQIPLHFYGSLLSPRDVDYLKEMITKGLARKTGAEKEAHNAGTTGTHTLNLLENHYLPQAEMTIMGDLLQNKALDDEITGYEGFECSTPLTMEEVNDYLVRVDTQYAENFEICFTSTSSARITSIALAESWSTAKKGGTRGLETSIYSSISRKGAEAADPFLLKRETLALGISAEQRNLAGKTADNPQKTVWFKYGDVKKLMKEEGLDTYLFEAQFAAHLLNKLELKNEIGKIKTGKRIAFHKKD